MDGSGSRRRRGVPGRRTLPVDEAVRAELGSPIVIRRLAGGQRSRVWLVEFDGTPAIVKQVVRGHDADERFHREVTALRLAARARPRVVPALLATDPHARVLVLEYLTVRDTSGDEWVVEYATALARLHATTGSADAQALPVWTSPGGADVDAFLALATELAVPIPPRAADELERLLGRLVPAGRPALLHGDPCPDNAMLTADGMRFVDLEQAALGQGQTELAYVHIGFPTCWCVADIPDRLCADAEVAYRSTWNGLTNGLPSGDLADACAGWLIRGDALVPRARRGSTDHLARVRRRDWKWGTGTARERLVHRLGVVATMGADRADLAGLAELSRTMRHRILRRWPRLNPLPVGAIPPRTP